MLFSVLQYLQIPLLNLIENIFWKHSIMRCIVQIFPTFFKVVFNLVCLNWSLVYCAQWMHLKEVHIQWITTIMVDPLYFKTSGLMDQTLVDSLMATLQRVSNLILDHPSVDSPLEGSSIDWIISNDPS